MADRVRALWMIAVAQLLVLVLWFSASAVSDQLQDAWGLTGGQVPFLTMAVQVGFVVGAVASAVGNLADRIPARRLFVVAALTGSAANGLLALVGNPTFGVAVGLRFLTGMALAGVYPSGMKAISGWFRRGRGTALGVLVGALTVGSAFPHLIRGLGLDWRGVTWAASITAVAGAILMGAVGDGPFEVPPIRFSWGHLRQLSRNEGFLLATVGYVGHMWELYAAWAWVGSYLAAAGVGARGTSVATFAVIGVGGVGAWLAGVVADRWGRTLAAGGSLMISGTAAAATVAVFGAPLWVMLLVLLPWGFTVVSDSAQFSAMVTEVVAPEVRGTALTTQTAVGFLITLGSIWMVPRVAEVWGWRWSFLVLLPGPVLGLWAMVRLRASPYADRLAAGLG